MFARGMIFCNCSLSVGILFVPVLVFVLVFARVLCPSPSQRGVDEDSGQRQGLGQRDCPHFLSNYNLFNYPIEITL